MAATTSASMEPTTSTPTSGITPTTSTTDPNEAASKLVEAIDDFLGDIEKKFKGISEEILSKLDDMAERCDRLEQEMSMRDSGRSATAAVASGSEEGSVNAGEIGS